MSSDRVSVGAIGGAFGVQGEVRLKSFCADPAAIADYTPLYSEDGRAFSQIVLSSQISNGFAARIGGISTKEEADALKGVTLYADRSNLPALPDAFYPCNYAQPYAPTDDAKTQYHPPYPNTPRGSPRC